MLVQCLRQITKKKEEFSHNEIQQKKDLCFEIFPADFVKEMQTISSNNYPRFPFLFTF